MRTILQALDLYKQYEGTEVLKKISISIQPAEFVAVMGQSGCGKSTLLYNISGMDKTTRGTVLFNEKDISSFSEEEMCFLRLEKMGFIFQNSNLLKNLSIRDNIILPGFQLGKVSRKEINQRCDALMKRTGILEIADHDIRKVSGGQLQRAAICRSLINMPEIIYGDEPTGALNSAATKEVMDIFNEINQERTAIMLVTHDAKVAARADRVIYLEDGEIKDEYALGKFIEKKNWHREKKLAEWLEKMGF